jgi:hypothetical protein
MLGTQQSNRVFEKRGRRWQTLGDDVMARLRQRLKMLKKKKPKKNGCYKFITL